MGGKTHFKDEEFRKTTSGLLNVFLQEPLHRVSVGDVVWGTPNPLVKLGNAIRPEEDRVPEDKFGFFVGKNASSRGVLRALTGTTDWRDVGRVLSFNGEDRLSFWRDAEGDKCNELRSVWN